MIDFLKNSLIEDRIFLFSCNIYFKHYTQPILTASIKFNYITTYILNIIDMKELLFMCYMLYITFVWFLPVLKMSLWTLIIFLRIVKKTDNIQKIIINILFLISIYFCFLLCLFFVQWFKICNTLILVFKKLSFFFLYCIVFFV